MPLHPSIAEALTIDHAILFMGPRVESPVNPYRLPIVVGDTVTGDCSDSDNIRRIGKVRGFTSDPHAGVQAVVDWHEGAIAELGRTDLRLLCEAPPPAWCFHGAGTMRTDYTDAGSESAHCQVLVDEGAPRNMPTRVDGRLSGGPVDQEAGHDVVNALVKGQRQGWIFWQLTRLGGATVALFMGCDEAGEYKQAVGKEAIAHYMICRAHSELGK